VSYRQNDLARANSFVSKILPVSPLNSKILAPYTTYLVDSIRPGGGGRGGVDAHAEVGKRFRSLEENGRDFRLLAAGSA